MAQVAEITHEGGDLSEYDSTQTDGGDLSVTTGAALAGTSYGLQCVVDDTTAIYGQKDLASAIDHTRLRLYIDPNSMSAVDTNDYLYVLRIRNSANDNAGYLYLNGPGTSDYQIELIAVKDNASWVTAAVANVTDEPHYVEIEIQAASGAGNNDGVAKLWVDGAYIGGLTNIDNDTQAATMDEFRFGAGDITDMSGTFYLDEIVANDDGQEIGPRVGLPPLAMSHYRRRRV